MDTKIQVSETQLKEIKDLQLSVNILIRQYGIVHLQKKALEEEIRSIEVQLEQLESQRVEIVKRLETEFGMSGTVDLDTGEFLPN